VTGVLVMRVGPQRCLKWVGILMCVGLLLTLIAPSMLVLTLGLLLRQIGALAIAGSRGRTGPELARQRERS